MRKIKTLSDKATLRTLKDEINEQFAALGRKVLDENRPKAVPMKTIESLDDLRQLAEGGNE
jgi:hypothetical protein